MRHRSEEETYNDGCDGGRNAVCLVARKTAAASPRLPNQRDDECDRDDACVQHSRSIHPDNQRRRLS